MKHKVFSIVHLCVEGAELGNLDGYEGGEIKAEFYDMVGTDLILCPYRLN